MTTLTITKKCVYHTPNKSAISTVGDDQFTFCEVCEENITRFWLEYDGDRLDGWSNWKVGK